MPTYTIHVFATATVTAPDKVMAEHVLQCVADSHGSVNLTAVKEYAGCSIFVNATINPDGELTEVS